MIVQEETRKSKKKLGYSWNMDRQVQNPQPSPSTGNTRELQIHQLRLQHSLQRYIVS